MIKSITASKNVKNERMLNFYKNYEKEVTPIVGKYEWLRWKCLIVLLVVSGVIIFLEVASHFSILGYVKSGDIIGIIVAIALYIAPFVIAYGFVNGFYLRRVKEDLLQNVLKGVGEIYWLPNTQLITNETLNKSHLFSQFNERANDDTFQGKYNGLNFKISESEMKYVTGSGKDKSVYPVFDGVIILIDSNKNIKADTIITTKGDNNIRNSNNAIAIIIAILVYYFSSILYSGVPSQFGPLLEFGLLIFSVLIYFALKSFFSKKTPMSNMQLEDPEFNKKYDAYTQDQVEGRYLITPTFMERFKNLHTSFGTNKAKCAFFDNKIMFALSTKKNLFELAGGIFSSLKNPKQTKIFYEEISAIYDLIDYFKLDEKTGL